MRFKIYIVRFGKAEYRSSWGAEDARYASAAQKDHLRWYVSVHA